MVISGAMNAEFMAIFNTIYKLFRQRFFELNMVKIEFCGTLLVFIWDVVHKFRQCCWRD